MMKDGIVACSDAQKREYQKKNKELIEFLESIDIMTVMSSCIYEKDGGPFPDSAEEKANGLSVRTEKPSPGAAGAENGASSTENSSSNNWTQ